ncbi:MAG: aldehyde dehydrogenase family protein, partial [Planctomycetaceae bacterium]
MQDSDQPSMAISAAASSFSYWAGLTLAEREDIVRRFAAEVAGNTELLVALLMEEVGKLRADAEAEVAAVVAKAEISIEMLHSRRGDSEIETPTGLAQVRYRPLGVVLVLGPFNFPAHLPGGQIIPALLAGNTVVFKPSELAPRVGQWLVEAWSRAGLPDGVLNLIQGGADVAQAAIADPRIAAVFFTGGYRAGAAIHRQLAGRPDVLLALEMGGINPVVLASPYDIDHAASLIVQSAFASAGQRCTCARRLVVVEDESGSRAIEEIVKRASELRCGLPDDLPAADMGPVISATAAQQLLRTQRDWLRSGGRALLSMVQSERSVKLVTPGIIDMTQAEWT